MLAWPLFSTVAAPTGRVRDASPMFVALACAGYHGGHHRRDRRRAGAAERHAMIGFEALWGAIN